MSTQPQNRDAQMPATLMGVSFGLGVALFLLAAAIAWLWFPDATWAKLVALLLFVVGVPPISGIVVLEIARRISR